MASGARDFESARYSAGAIFFHWAIALLIIVNLALGLLHEDFGRENIPFVMGLHKSIGLLVLLLSLGRVGWRITHRPPAEPAYLKTWEKLLAKGVHAFFYFAIIALPLTGWLMSSAAPKRYPLDFFGMFAVPYLPVAQNEGIAGGFSESHEIIAFITIALAILHVVGALKHQILDRDPFLSRMMPHGSKKTN